MATSPIASVIENHRFKSTLLPQYAPPVASYSMAFGCLPQMKTSAKKKATVQTATRPIMKSLTTRKGLLTEKMRRKKKRTLSLMRPKEGFCRISVAQLFCSVLIGPVRIGGLPLPKQHIGALSFLDYVLLGKPKPTKERFHSRPYLHVVIESFRSYDGVIITGEAQVDI